MAQDDSARSSSPGSSEVARATRDTEVTFTISGLSGWAAGDSLQLVSPNSGTTLAGIENDLAVYPRNGETTVAGQSVNWKHLAAPLLDAAKGETAVVTQLVAATSGGRSYAALARAGTAHGFTVRDGHPAALAVTLAPVAQDRTLALRWRGSQFAALTAQAGPGAEPGGAAAVAVSALPEAVARRGDLLGAYHAGLPGLVAFPPLPGADLDQTVVYGNPFKGSELATAVYAASVPVPTRYGIGSLPARFIAVVPVTWLAGSGELAPQLSPVRAVKLNGNALDKVTAGAGVSPVLSWEPPALGKATSYAVVVHLVDGSDQGVSMKPLATLTTRSTSLQLPASLLQAGGTYVAAITAISSSDRAFAAADHVTAQFTP